MMRSRDHTIRVALIGADGRFGTAIRAAARTAPDVELLAITRESWPGGATPDVIIDVSAPDVLDATVELSAATGAAVLYGVSNPGPARTQRLTELGSRVAVCRATNLNPLAHVMLQSVQMLARVAATLPERGHTVVSERHPVSKTDAPSGTARQMADAFDWPVSTHVERAGGPVCDHGVEYAVDGNRIQITHAVADLGLSARSAITTAVWLARQQPGFYTVSDAFSAMNSAVAEPAPAPGPESEFWIGGRR
ncbi:hypothetical protein GIY30_15680 [Gordonia sp. HNM0687]|uniref:Dihydrodipicolinate reductase C-terminal domain-containing protein n=1 Tax=Gordonia mangrovi TaxID=2665643 RepID=A0A6L7GTI7_9ACTN|nr:dihydrodipicolinate reductase C-terminal domain-containing protein [Gordonia mangrovi]MXP22782.1 hypothetical protein [Gordonia mangrovi]UVF77096.1 hypothetical protein NWF22_17480 [Gordonia mangrovi]